MFVVTYTHTQSHNHLPPSLPFPVSPPPKKKKKKKKNNNQQSVNNDVNSNKTTGRTNSSNLECGIFSGINGSDSGQGDFFSFPSSFGSDHHNHNSGYLFCHHYMLSSCVCLCQQLLDLVSKRAMILVNAVHMKARQALISLQKSCLVETTQVPHSALTGSQILAVRFTNPVS